MTDRLSFQSAGAVPPRAVRQINAVASFKPGSIQDAHYGLIQVLLDNPPLTIGALADADELDERARHARNLTSAVNAYLNALLDDTGACVVNRLDTRWLRARLNEVADEVVGELETAAETAREDAEWEG